MKLQHRINQPDTETADLIILATRSWVRATLTAKGSEKRAWHKKAWDSCFEVVGSDPAAKTFEAFLKHFAREAKAQFALGCACCGRISADERRIVEIIQDMQAGDLSAAQEKLSLWFANQELWEAEALCESFADQLLVTGFSVEAIGVHVYSSICAERPRDVIN